MQKLCDECDSEKFRFIYTQQASQKEVVLHKISHFVLLHVKLGLY